MRGRWIRSSGKERKRKQKRIEGYTGKVGRDQLRRSHESEVLTSEKDGQCGILCELIDETMHSRREGGEGGKCDGENEKGF